MMVRCRHGEPSPSRYTCRIRDSPAALRITVRGISTLLNTSILKPSARARLRYKSCCVAKLASWPVGVAQDCNRRRNNRHSAARHAIGIGCDTLPARAPQGYMECAGDTTGRQYPKATLLNRGALGSGPLETKPQQGTPREEISLEGQSLRQVPLKGKP